MPAPTLTSQTGSTWNDRVNTDEATGTLTWNAGDRILVVGFTEDQTLTLGTPTATGLTFAAVGTPITTSNSCWMHVWEATAGSSGSGVITGPRATGTGTGMRGIHAWAWGTCTGFVRTDGAATDATQTVSVTRTQANSAVVFASADWSAGGTGGLGWTPAGQTQLQAAHNAAGATAFAAYWGDQGATGTTSYGTTGLAGTTFSKLAVEVLGTVGAAVTDYAGPWNRLTPGRNSPTGRLRPQPYGPAKPAPAALLGTPEETDTAIAVGRAKARTLGIASETDTAIAVGRSKVRAVGVAAETDTAPAVTVAVAQPHAGPWRDFAPGWQSPTGVFATILGQSVTGVSQSVALGVAAESDAAVAVGRIKTLTVGAAAEADTAGVVGRIKARAVGAAAEADIAGSLGRLKTGAVGAAAETDTAVAVGAVQPSTHPYARPWTGLTPGWQSPTGHLSVVFGNAQALPAAQSATLGIASETDTAIAVGRAKARAVGVAVETDTAVAIIGVRQVYAGPWRDLAPGWMSPTGVFALIVGETLAAAAQSAAVGAAAEADTAGVVGRIKARTVGAASETGTAGALGRLKTGAVGAAAETDTAAPVGGATAQLYAGPWRDFAPGWQSPTGMFATILGEAPAAVPQSAAVGVADETDVALPVTGTVATAQLYAGPWTDLAPGWQSPTGVFATILGETRPPVGATVGVAGETDTAQPVGRVKTRTVGTAEEVDVAPPLYVAGVIPQPYARPWTGMTPGWVSPTGQLAPLSGDTTPTNVTTVAVGIATTTDTAVVAGRAKVRAVGTASAAGTAVGITSPGWLLITSETDTAETVGRVKVRTAGVATTTAAALAISWTRQRQAGTGSETDLALPVAGSGGAVLRRPGIHTAGATRARLAAGATRAELTATTFRGPHIGG